MFRFCEYLSKQCQLQQVVICNLEVKRQFLMPRMEGHPACRKLGCSNALLSAF